MFFTLPFLCTGPSPLTSPLKDVSDRQTFTAQRYQSDSLITFFFLTSKVKKQLILQTATQKHPHIPWYAHTVCVNRYWLKQLRPAEAWI